MVDAPFHYPNSPAALRPRDVLAAMVRAWRRERALRATVGRLAALDDHMLRDIGLSRGDIAAGVRRKAGTR